MSNQRKLQHLCLRAGFGESISEINRCLNLPLSKKAEQLFQDSSNYTELNINKELEFTPKKLRSDNPKELTKEVKKKLAKQSREDIKDLNIKWIEKMTHDKAQLREKMTLFWHGHFACRTPIAVFAQNQNNTLRKYALGKFGDLLMEISKDPAMLQFLNNQQNKKSNPNENFARELMELFTLGRGNYTEHDIKEAARAFTGWSFNKEGEFIFRRNAHDSDDKTFFGRTGNFTGEDIINIILENKRTAEFITEKIYRHFVNEKLNRDIIEELSKKFYQSQYNIEGLMKNIFLSDWFYDKENIGAKIKSPVEFIVGMNRSFNVEYKNPMPLLALQKVMGQMLFNPPNVAGWSGGKNWIDTSSLMYRLKLPENIFKSSNLEFDYKEDPPEEGEMYAEQSKKEKKQYKIMKTKTDLSSYIKEFSKYNGKGILENLSKYLIQSDLNKETEKIIMSYADNSGKENLIESLTLRLITLPEYQLC